MERRMSKLVTATMLCVAALSLCGCQVLASSSTYTPQKKDAVVSSPAVSTDGTLKVGVNSSNAPFSTEVSGRLVGIDVDVAAALADEMGLSLELVDVGSDAAAALKEGSVDIVMGLDSTDTSGDAWLSDVYMPTCVALFASDANTAMPATETATTIEAQATSMSSWEATNQFPQATVKSAADLKTAFSDLASGSTNYVASDAVIGSYVAHSSGTDAVIVGSLQKVGGYSVGVLADNDDLKKAITTAVKTITTNGTVKVVESKWLGQALALDELPLSASAQKATDASASAGMEAATGDAAATEGAATEGATETSSAV